MANLDDNDVRLYAHEAARQAALEAVRAMAVATDSDGSRRCLVYQKVYNAVFGFVYEKLS